MTLDKLRNKASERVGVIAAMPVEARALGASEPFNQILELTSNTYAYVCGAGPDNARRAMQELLTMNVAGVVSWGTAGGLTPNLVPGTALLSKKVICADSAYETDGYWAGRLRDHFNSILTINDEAIYSSGQLVSGMAEKKRL
ncbi:MAG: hypothetical protein OES99_00100, partial [Gammaproteobacteria bacterium]|nr:hypothetical protein [Gammaproteobacteria bacterium]